MPERLRIFERYLQQDYLTPGAAETLALFLSHAPPGPDAAVLEIASGKGTTALTLARDAGCRVLGVDAYGPFVREADGRAATAGLAARVAFVLGDGGRTPARDGAFDAAICIGAPSIVGTKRCLAAMYRALRPGGHIAISDWTWRTPEPPAEAVPAGVAPPYVTTEAYSALVRDAGFEILHGEPLPQRVWDAYYAPLRAIAAEERARVPDAPEDVIESEIRAYDAGGALWAYTAYVGRKRGA